MTLNTSIIFNVKVLCYMVTLSKASFIALRQGYGFVIECLIAWTRIMMLYH